jgi:hypothetical protein
MQHASRGSQYEEIAPHSPSMKERVLKQHGPEERNEPALVGQVGNQQAHSARYRVHPSIEHVLRFSWLFSRILLGDRQTEVFWQLNDSEFNNGLVLRLPVTLPDIPRS